MNGLITLVKDNFSAFMKAMFVISSRFQIRYVNDFGEVAVLVVVLTVAVGAVFLSARLMKKYKTGFPASVLLAFLVLSLTLALTGFLLSIPRLFVDVSNEFLIVGIGSPLFNLALSVMTALGNRLRNNHLMAGTLALCVTGFLFAYLLFVTFIVFALPLINN